MKIENDKKAGLLESILKSSQSRQTKDTGINGQKGGGEQADRVELSSRKAEIASIKEKVKAAPVVNQEKVDRIRDAIKADTYDVNGRMVARSLMKSNILDQVF